MNSEERRAARRERREEKRAAKRAARIERCTLEEVADMNSLYRAQRQAARGVSWKASTQRYQINWLLNINRTRRDLLAGNDVRRGFHEFDVFERGKLRHISSVHFSERVIHKSLSQNALVPAITPSLIDRNTANMKGKGLSYALKKLKKDLADHYREHGSDGYVLLMDYSGYFASIDHGGVKKLVRKHLDDPRLIALSDSLIDSQGERGLGLGSEPNQVWAVAYPNPIDHYVTELCHVEAYGRYMDDSYAIHESKDHLRLVAACVAILCEDMGIVPNPKKTRIVKLSNGFTFLKKKIFYGEDGKVVMRPCRESITRERRKLKRQAGLVSEGVMSLEDVTRSYQSWRGSLTGLSAQRTMESMDALFRSLFKITEDPPQRPKKPIAAFMNPSQEGFFFRRANGT